MSKVKVLDFHLCIGGNCFYILSDQADYADF